MDATTEVAREEPEAPPALPASRVRELGVAAAVLAAGVGVLLARSTITAAHGNTELGPQWWPAVLGVALVVGAVALGALGALRPQALDEEPASGHGVVQLVAVLALIVAYGAAWYQLHFLVVTVPLIAGLVYVTGGRGLRPLVVFPAVTTALLYVIFGVLLRVPV